MKRRIGALLLFVYTFTAQYGFGDSWNPGNPKPPLPPAETWFTDVTKFFNEFWGYLIY